MKIEDLTIGQAKEQLGMFSAMQTSNGAGIGNNTVGCTNGGVKKELA